jgi:hypothetical protein
MASKREERKQRAEEHRVAQEQQKRKRQWRSRAVFAVGALVLIAAAFMATRRRDGDESNGRVWSAAHGHWHDK